MEQNFRERLQAIPTLDKTRSPCGVDHQGAFSTTFIFKQEHHLAKRRKIPFLCPGTSPSPGGGEALGTEVQQPGAGDVSLSSVFGEIQTITLNGHTCCGQWGQGDRLHWCLDGGQPPTHIAGFASTGNGREGQVGER